jgi:biopolymer transport protein ExbB
MDISSRLLALTLHGAGWVLWLLIGLSILSLTVILERLWYFATHRPSTKLLAGDMRALLTEAERSDDGDALGGALEGAKSREKLRLERNLAFLGTLGSNAPFIGLFGTVLGIIKAFHDLAGSQAGGPAVVMSGISESLVATAVGLLVAIPAVVAFNYFNRRVRSTMSEVDWIAQLALIQVKGEMSATEEA